VNIITNDRITFIENFHFIFNVLISSMNHCDIINFESEI
jgi:hypothetical protein